METSVGPASGNYVKPIVLFSTVDPDFEMEGEKRTSMIDETRLAQTSYIELWAANCC